MSIEIKEDSSTYDDIINFLSKKKIKKQKIKEIRFGKTNNLVVVLNNNKNYSFPDYPQKITKLMEKENTEFCRIEQLKNNKKKILISPIRQAFHDNEEKVVQFVNEKFKVNDDIYFTIVLNKKDFQLVFNYNNKSSIYTINYEYLLGYYEIVFENELKLFVNMNIFKTVILDIIKDFQIFKNKEYIMYLKRNSKTFSLLLQEKLQERYNNLCIKDGHIQIVTGNSYKKTEINLDKMYPEENFFKIEYDTFEDLQFPIKITLNEEKVKNTINEVIRKIDYRNVKLSDKTPLMFYDWMKKFMYKNIETYTGILNDRMMQCRSFIVSKNGTVYIRTENNYMYADEFDGKLMLKYAKNKEKFQFILSEKYNETVKFLNPYFEDATLISGDGLLFGTSKIWIKETEIEFQSVPIFMSEKYWKSEIQSFADSLDERILNVQLEKYKKLRQEEPFIFGSPLARDILQILERSDGSICEEIILDVIYQKKSLVKDISKFNIFQDYNLIPEKDMKEMIQALLRQRYAKNHFGLYNQTISLNENKKLFNGMIQETDRELEEHITKNDYISVDELTYLLEKGIQEQKEYLIFLSCINNLEFLSINRKKYISYMKDVSNYKTIFKMKYENGFYDDKSKGVKDIIKEIIE